MTFLRFDFCAFSAVIAFLTLPAMCQVPAQPPATPAARTPAAPAPAQPAKTQAAQPTAAQGQQPAVPDYPEPRTLTIGAFYWLTGPGTRPSIYTGSQALDYETLTGLGKPHRSPGIEASIPITRTGELHFEYIRTKGDGNQLAPATTDVFGTTITQGDYLATQYQMQRAKLYLDDLLFPHKFPVARFRVKSLWEVQWVQIKTTADAPYVDNTGVQETATGTKQIVFPTFGLAAEYALTRHILLRADASGFGLPHKADLADANATISYRLGSWEIVAGGKAFHFKTSPNSTEYISATMAGAFVGLRWHWSL